MTDNTEHKAVNQWMLANGWEWMPTNAPSTGYWRKDGLRTNQDVAAEMYRMADRRVEEARIEALALLNDLNAELFHSTTQPDGQFIKDTIMAKIKAIEDEQFKPLRATHHPKGGSNARIRE